MRLEHLTSSQLRDALTRSSSAVDTGALAETARHAVLFGDGVLQAIASSQHSAFDSELFAAPVYRIPHAAAEDRVGYQQVHRLTLEVLERDGAAQVVRRIDAANFDELWALQALGYRIVDIGVTFRLVPTPERLPQLKQGLEVGPASDADIAALLDTAASIFRTSHFYVDPFYPEERANELHRRWLSNCHHAGLADVVLVSREGTTPTGFVTCKVHGSAPGGRVGDIALVGVHREHQGKQIGTAIVAHALHWFSTRCDEVHVRTQAYNYGAVNLYEKNGFRLFQSDVTLSKRLWREE